MDTPLFDGKLVHSQRIIYTPSPFARASLVHLQEVGTLQARSPHASTRQGLASYLFFMVESGSGTLEYEKIMDFQYRLVVNENDPLATKKLNGYEDLEPYIELIHGDSRLPNGEYLDIKETPENQNAHRRIHVYERGNQFMLLKDIPGTYMWVSPIPEELLRRNGLAQRKIEWQQRRMKDVMVYPGRKFLSEDEREFIRQLKKEAIEVSK